MLQEIFNLAHELEIGDGGLLKLARDISQNNNLQTIDRLTKVDRLQLLQFLRRVAHHDMIQVA